MTKQGKLAPKPTPKTGVSTPTSGTLTIKSLAENLQQISTVLDNLQTKYSDLNVKCEDLGNDNSKLKEANHILNCEMEYMKQVINSQASRISQLDSEIDGQNQYSRRENLVFTNLRVDDNNDVKSQVINLCKEINVDITTEDFVDAHVLPKNKGKPTRYIARLHSRGKAKQIFANRRNLKQLNEESRKKLSTRPDKGLSIQPNLTPKRAKFFSQVQDFNRLFNYFGTWVDTNSNKIFIKTNEGARGVYVKDTSDLIQINSNYKPATWYFCSGPLFHFAPNSDLPQPNPQHYKRPTPRFDPYDPYGYPPCDMYGPGFADPYGNSYRSRPVADPHCDVYNPRPATPGPIMGQGAFSPTTPAAGNF